MGFKTIEVNAVESDQGFIVRRKNRFELEYIENDERVVIEVEPGQGLAVYVSNLHLKNKEHIVKNICDALEYMGVNYILD